MEKRSTPHDADPAASATNAADPTLAPFHHPVFRAVWIASLVSNFGGLIQSVGAAWMMTTVGGTPQQVALVQGATTLPILLLALWAGAAADNLDKRKVMLWAQLAMLALSVAPAVLAWIGGLSPAILLFFTFAIACGTAINGPAWQASVSDMVPRAALPQAVALNGMGFNIARSVGPAVGGAIIALAGAAAAFLVNALSYVGLIVVLARWRPVRPPRLLPREQLGGAMTAGLRYAVMSPHLRVVLGRAAIFGIGASAVPALLPLVARDLIGGGPLTYGLLFGGFGLGAVVGALVLQPLRRRWSTEGVTTLASLVLAAGAIGAGLGGSLLLALPAMTLAGAGWVFALATLNVSVQLATPRWVVARALALFQMAAYGGMALGSWLFGIAAQDHGPAIALMLAGGVLIVSALSGRLYPLSDTDDVSLDPLDDWKEPDTAVPVDMRSGPITITVEHRIAPGDIVAFLALMSERRRIRMRDGARHWLLSRDLADPTLWIERFDFATWLDYVRHNQRRTIADAENQDALRQLRIGGLPSVVHRLIERSVGVVPTSLDEPTTREPMTDPTRAA